MIFPCWKENNNIVHVLTAMVSIIMKNTLHKLQEFSRGVLNSERHSQEIEPASVVRKCRLSHIFLNYGDRIIPLGEVYLINELGFSHFQSLSPSWACKRGSVASLVYGFKIATWACRSVTFSDSHHGRERPMGCQRGV